MLLWVKLLHDLPPSMWLCVDGKFRPQHNPRALRTGRSKHKAMSAFSVEKGYPYDRARKK
jgi:hypothetical protein